MKHNSVGKRGKNIAQETSPWMHFNLGLLTFPMLLFSTTTQKILPLRQEKESQAKT